ncbi:ly6/PLAUR domain-containing protein 8 [Microcebus murinus]|uniref:LY6/PLAUR domain containing 8 n=1 Tax=Microcebus murinus TaxID=30608 RepID=A0A8B7FMK6_MICMU|nr:ly6/PLAUR domain-containing protein 8 isoform X2 [Microcebus murinus]XP_012610025.1 ly6/PLAUR domain-containing protein 8 isoform X2 [Microcebus murinus]XP_012610027.1 ly6/PLAUR domain-containing protein 8 isoform X2 [Microcebus murinus]XP_012610028.1 ly6/PLAUR domain-containing protein 8 isoform X2 [Microcebus murinus]
MKGILVAAVIAALAVAAVESTSCLQCHSWNNSCVDAAVFECPLSANNSCVSSTVNSSLGAAIRLYQAMSCSAENCSEETNTVMAFAVHTSDNESFHFASQCCQGGGCNSTSEDLDPPLRNVTSNIECPACYGPNETACVERIHRCYEGERCVSLVAEFTNGTASQRLALKGCSDLSDSACRALSAGNTTLGGVIFRKVECAASPATSPTTSPTTSPATSPASLASLAFLVLAGLALLGLLL